jgi:ankyrin repeat protein
MKLLINKGANIHTKNDDGKNALSSVAHHGSSDMIKLLLALGADIESADNNGLTALHYAFRGGCVRSTQLLVDRRAQIDAIDTKGRIVLYLAVAKEGKRSDGEMDYVMVAELLQSYRSLQGEKSVSLQGA